MSSSSSSSSLSTTSYESEPEELQLLEHAPPFWRNQKRLSKQVSMCETPRNIAWEKKSHQRVKQEGITKKRVNNDGEELTDEDLNELKGCIELGFGFKEEQGQKLCNTLPALDLYFAVNRQLLLSPSPVSTPNSSGSLPSLGGSSSSLGGRSSSFGSRSSDESWKICSPGDDPQQVKTKLRHWAQAVACSVMQFS